VYLAGYEVFFESDKAAGIAQAKQRICASWGLEGVFPGDAELSPDLPASRRAADIYATPSALISRPSGV
jgi:nucleoside 2-deoxyribosyltransferase